MWELGCCPKLAVAYPDFLAFETAPIDKGDRIELRSNELQQGGSI
ncbi:hypothetical protein NIASO_01620 [Niabella soli DSM 19437]|uniref:Uncharacterized protein n=1 Tax=Niabella soli DSM 19437 TaxID=929713 RepID=W0F264_9BACT|nr:hypothetical protein NIASO_01620 [Niabella soli DSM 19437]